MTPFLHFSPSPLSSLETYCSSGKNFGFRCHPDTKISASAIWLISVLTLWLLYNIVAQLTHVSKIDSSLFAQSLTWNKPSTICSPERLQKSNICQTNNSFLLNSLPFKSDSLRYKSSLVTFSAFFLAPVMISPSIQQCKFCGKMLENL